MLSFVPDRHCEGNVGIAVNVLGGKCEFFRFNQVPLLDLCSPCFAHGGDPRFGVSVGVK